MQLLAMRLNDDNGSVRAEAALMLTKFGSQAATYILNLQHALTRERDPVAHDSIHRAIAVIRGAPR
jgi:HEAT repeat protein